MRVQVLPEGPFPPVDQSAEPSNLKSDALGVRVSPGGLLFRRCGTFFLPPGLLLRMLAFMNTPVILEDYSSGSVKWSVSFDGPNPSRDQCVDVASEEDATRLVKLINPKAPLTFTVQTGMEREPDVSGPEAP